MPKQIELIFGVRFTTEDSHFVLDQITRVQIHRGKQKPSIRRCMLWSLNHSFQFMSALSHGQPFHQLLKDIAVTEFLLLHASTGS